MQKSEQIRLLKELMRHRDEDTNVDAGGQRRNPAFVYSDPELAAREWETFFEGHPQFLGLSGDLPEPGSFLTSSDFGGPILAVRDDAGVFRAFANTCRHRGAVLEGRDRGKASRFVCPFHAWTYSNLGELVGIPKAGHFGPFDESCHGLIELPAVEAHGFLFVHPDPKGRIDAEALLGGLAPEFDSWAFGDLVYTGSDTYDMKLNWKLAMDTFGETYHFNQLHKNTLAQFFYGNAQCYDVFGRNHRMILCLQTLDDLRNKPEEEWHITHGGFPVYYLFPNVQLNVGATGLTAVRTYPDPANPGRSISRVSFYASETALELDAQLATDRARIFGDVIRDEDYAVAEGSQRSADAGLQEYVVFGRNEPALHHYHNTYREALGMEPLELIQD
jgi:phenylpropionate dioxygenase-like ring-hydroxylating dioxygenase large terminal subunit